jgi:hypothetical protein
MRACMRACLRVCGRVGVQAQLCNSSSSSSSCCCCCVCERECVCAGISEILGDLLPTAYVSELVKGHEHIPCTQVCVCVRARERERECVCV